MKRRSRHNLLIAVATAMDAQLVCNTAAQEPCKLAAIGTTIVAAVRDGRTLLLANGRELRLGGIEVTDDSRATLQPWSPDVRCDSNGSGLATTATAGWSHLLFRALLREGPAADRIRAYRCVWADKACADALLSTERAARSD